MENHQFASTVLQKLSSKLDGVNSTSINVLGILKRDWESLEECLDSRTIVIKIDKKRTRNRKEHFINLTHNQLTWCIPLQIMNETKVYGNFIEMN